MKDLTKSEEQIMQILWKLEKAFVNEVIGEYPEPKPAYNTVSTIIRILETKGFVSHAAFGKTHQYFPLVSKDDYSSSSLNKLVTNYFDNSYQNLVSFFSKDKEISVDELEAMKRMIESELNNKKEK
jgi:predicted transcriptional regulator